MVSPIYDKLSEEYKNFKFCKINVDENSKTPMEYHIISIPMQVFFNNGEKVDEILGAVPENVIRSKVEDILKRFPTDEKGRLKVILGSWIDHNKNHSEKFRKWEEKAKNARDAATYSHILQILQAVKKIEEANKQLAKVLIEF
jgi:thioredoxin-like negative regulator of GroEL